MILAAVRDDIASFIQALALVYVILIIAHILISMVFSFGGRIPYSRWSDAIITFLRDTVEPYLRIFRRFIPMVGPLDLSPIVAIFVLQIGANVLANIVAG